MIISASRRTDIPAFYSPWFINRIREGFLLTRNPFNAKQVSRVSLLPQDVDAIVFWTRNPAKLLPFLPELDNSGYRYYFQYTITGYPRTLEKSVPNPHRAIQTFQELSSFIGKERVIWRYDPILVCNQIDLNEHKRLFTKIARLLAGYTQQVVISFADFYQKTDRNLKNVENLIYSDITRDNNQLLDLTAYMATVAKQHRLEITSCAEELDISDTGINHGKCIDEKLLYDVFAIRYDGTKDSGQRKACGCIKSIDIGMYNTCLHGCSYCYATFQEKTVLANYRKHDPMSHFLVGANDADCNSLAKNKICQSSLF